jgi:hypothetical protein
MGEPIANLGKTSVMGEVRIVLHPPDPNPNFDLIYVVAFPNTGVCAIYGSGVPIGSDERGEQVKHKVDELANLLSKKYGDYSDKRDDCEEAVELCGPYWSLELSKDMARYAYRWSDPARAAPFGIAKLATFAVSDNGIATRANVVYFSADKACGAAQRAADGAGL